MLARKKLMTLVAVVLLVSTMLSACAQPTPETVVEEVEVPVEVTKEVEVEVVVTATPAPAEPEKITVSFMTMNLKDAFGDYIEGVIAAYEAENPNTEIEWIDVSSNQKEWTMANLVAGTLPDVFDQQASRGLPELASMGALVDVEEYVTDAQQAEYFKSAWDGARLNGVAYGIPWYGGGRVFYWNKDLFEEAGLDPDVPPTTYTEALELARTIQEGTTAPYGYAFYISDYLGTPMLMSEGVQLVGSDGAVAVNSERTAEVFDRWKAAYDEGIIPPEAVVDYEHSDVYADVNWFASGQAGMLVRTGGGVIRNLPEGFNVGIGPAPEGTPYFFHYFAIPTQSEHPQEAVDFALYFTNWENQLEFCKLVAVMPSTKKTAADAYFDQEPTTSAQEAAGYMLSELNDDSLVISLIPGWGEMVGVLKEHWSKQMLGEETTEQALGEIEKAWNLIIGSQ